jgi:hypothetical protein
LPSPVLATARCSMIDRRCVARSSASAFRCLPMSGLPSCWPRALAAASASLVRCAIRFSCVNVQNRRSWRNDRAPVFRVGLSPFRRSGLRLRMPAPTSTGGFATQGGGPRLSQERRSLVYRWFPLILEVVTIVRPETLVRWHRAGFRRFIELAGRAPANRDGIAGADQADEHGEPALGCATHPRRTNWG